MSNYYGSDSKLMAGRPARIDTSRDVPAWLPKASLSKRLGAYVIDIVILVVGIGVMSLFGAGGLGLAFLTMQSYFLVSELAFRKSIGKKLLGLEVVSDDLTRASAGQIFGRALLRPIDELLVGVIGLVCAVATENNQRLGDLVASTVVVES